MPAGLGSTQAQRDRGMSVPVDRKVMFLASPLAYVERPTQVETIETHYSWVFLTDRYVYKLKKPLRGTGFDFSTIEARLCNAETEVRPSGSMMNPEPIDVTGISGMPKNLRNSSSSAAGGRPRSSP